MNNKSVSKAILEAISEVELDVTPEFQKPDDEWDMTLEDVTVDWLIDNVELGSDDAVFDVRSGQDLFVKHNEVDPEDDIEEARVEVLVSDVWDTLSDSTQVAMQSAFDAHQ